MHPLCDPCATCGEPLAALEPAAPGPGDSRLCSRCRARTPLVTCSRAAGAYEGTLRTAIHALKYDSRRSLARPLARLMRSRAAAVLADADAVVPVPLHRARHRARGFNQAADLACHLGPPVSSLLTRVRATHPQADLSEHARESNVRGAFGPSRCIGKAEGRVLVLVDDVSTTGATLEACAAVLLEAGAADVRAITAARAVRGRP